jgi:hypothetical protein
VESADRSWMPQQPEPDSGSLSAINNLEEIAHRLGIHGPDLIRPLLAVAAVVSLSAATALARRAWSGEGRRRRPPAGAISILVICATLSTGLLIAGVGNATYATPTVSQVMPTTGFGSLGAVQVVKVVRVAAPRQLVTLPRVVGRDDYLLLVFGGMGYRGLPQEVLAVEDNLNGPWKALHRPGGRTPDGAHWVDFVVFRIAPSKPGRMTITISGSLGQSGATLTILDLAGPHSEITSGFADADAVEPFPATGADYPGAAPGDLLIGVFAIYDYGQRLTDQPGWTLDVVARAADCAATVVFHRTVPTTADGVAAPLLQPSPAGAFGIGIIRLRPKQAIPNTRIETDQP